MGIVVREVKSRRDLKRYVKFPFKLYADNKVWAPSLRSDDIKSLSEDKNPAYEYCDTKSWIAYKDGKIAGRITGIKNMRHVEKWGDKSLRFGWIDFIDDTEVSKALLERVENWARELGMTSVIGPLGFTDLDKSGMLVEGFDEQTTIATIYNYAYYPEHLELHGYQKDVDWIEFEGKVPSKASEEINKIALVAAERNKVRLLEVKNRKELLPYTKSMFDAFNESYSKLYGMIPLTEKQIDMYTKQYFSFIKPEFVAIVLDNRDRVVGFGISVPSLSEAMRKAKGRLLPFGIFHLLRALKRNKIVDLYIIGVLPEYQGKGINAIMINKLLNVYIDKGIKIAETNPELESNIKVQMQWKYFETRQHKRRRCYRKNLG